MSAVLPSGSVLPSGLLEQGMESVSAYDHSFKNYSIKMGVIINAYDIDDQSNINKVGVEYDVAVTEQNGHLAQNVITYQNCMVMESFGGIADYTEYRLRPQNKVENKRSNKDMVYQDGSLVLIMCISGSSDNAIIIGGLKHPKRKTNLTKDSGLSLYSEYNGLVYSIDKNGALKILFKGATDQEGKAIDEKVSGSVIEISKDGSLSLSDGNKESIRIDKTNKTIGLNSEKTMSLSTDDSLLLSSKKETSMKMDKWIVSAQGDSKISAASFDIKSKGSFKVDASDFSFKASGAVDIQGSNIKLQGQQITLQGQVFLGAAGGAPALTSAAQFLGTGYAGTPVLSTAISGFSSKVFLV